MPGCPVIPALATSRQRTPFRRCTVAVITMVLSPRSMPMAPTCASPPSSVGRSTIAGSPVIGPNNRAYITGNEGSTNLGPNGEAPDKIKNGQGWNGGIDDPLIRQCHPALRLARPLQHRAPARPAPQPVQQPLAPPVRQLLARPVPPPVRQPPARPHRQPESRQHARAAYCDCHSNPPPYDYPHPYHVATAQVSPALPMASCPSPTPCGGNLTSPQGGSCPLPSPTPTATPVPFRYLAVNVGNLAPSCWE